MCKDTKSYRTVENFDKRRRRLTRLQFLQGGGALAVAATAPKIGLAFGLGSSFNTTYIEREVFRHDAAGQEYPHFGHDGPAAPGDP